MISDKKFIQDVYRVQNFSTYFNMYVKILTFIVITLFLIRGAMWRLGGFFNDMLFPFLRIVLLLVTLTAIIIVPYVFWVLFKENKRSWIVGLVLVVLIPLLFLLLIFGLETFYNQSLLFPILLYSIFCYLLNSEVKDWLNEYYAHENRLEQKRLKEERIKKGLWD